MEPLAIQHKRHDKPCTRGVSGREAVLIYRVDGDRANAGVVRGALAAEERLEERDGGEVDEREDQEVEHDGRGGGGEGGVEEEDQNGDEQPGEAMAGDLEEEEGEAGVVVVAVDEVGQVFVVLEERGEGGGGH